MLPPVTGGGAAVRGTGVKLVFGMSTGEFAPPVTGANWGYDWPNVDDRIANRIASTTTPCDARRSAMQNRNAIWRVARESPPSCFTVNQPRWKLQNSPTYFGIVFRIDSSQDRPVPTRRLASKNREIFPGDRRCFCHEESQPPLRTTQLDWSQPVFSLNWRYAMSGK